MLLVLADMQLWPFARLLLALEGVQVLGLRIEWKPVGLCTRQTGCLGRTLCCRF